MADLKRGNTDHPLQILAVNISCVHSAFLSTAAVLSSALVLSRQIQKSFVLPPKDMFAETVYAGLTVPIDDICIAKFQLQEATSPRQSVP